MKSEPKIIISPNLYDPYLHSLIDDVQQYLHLPDPTSFILTLGCIVANRMEGPPVWLMLVASPASGKTEMLNTILKVPGVHQTATLTESGLLSGSGPKDQAKDATGGLLRQIGARGTMVAKDFTTVLSMQRDERAKILAAFRELYDGYWGRHIGTGGGRHLEWAGKLGFLGACTEDIDRKHAVITSMGDRFLYHRLAGMDRSLATRKVLNRNGITSGQRMELQEQVAQYAESLVLPDLNHLLGQADREWLEVAADVTSLARSTVERDDYGREITHVPSPESPVRIAGSMSQLYSGIITMGCAEWEARRIIREVALSCIPKNRSRLIERMAMEGAGLTVEAMRKEGRLIHPHTAVKRSLEEMECLGVCKRARGLNGGADLWTLDEEFAAQWMQV